MADEFLTALGNGENLSAADSYRMMLRLGRGEYAPEQVAAILMALKVKGETIDEIAGCANAFRQLAVQVPHEIDEVVFDCCGTGGDGMGTFNISTAASLVTAATGVYTAKHGNRAVSSRSGSADVLEALGVKIDLDPAGAAACLEETGFCFLFAPHYHPAMKHVAPVRRCLGIPTLFNILGPLLNPAGCTHQVIGTTDSAKAKLVSRVAFGIGLTEVTTLCSEAGLDEAVPSSSCHLFRTGSDGTVCREIDLNGIDPCSVRELTGGDAAENAGILMTIFAGEKSFRRDTVVLNAAIGLVETQRCADLEHAIAVCEEGIESGKVLEKLKQVIEFTNRCN
jgi:anthranilate phosphoribosyltransferase